jgi:hypothetical protein
MVRVPRECLRLSSDMSYDRHMDTARDLMREKTFRRDCWQCVLCGAPAQDAHHILERRLWPDGGYFLDNLASVCGHCHLLCEQTVVSVEEIRHAAGIDRIAVPPHMYPDETYDKWGNVVRPDGTISPGELFWDESVQKVLRQGGVRFSPYVKYPRTHHLPWSLGMTSDDRIIEDLSVLKEAALVATIKMDGENTTLYPDGYVHARPIDGASHESQSWVRSMWAKVAHELPYGWRVCGENLYAVHSIRYADLPSYLMIFAIWNERNECLSWNETREWAELLGFPTVPTIYHGEWDEEALRDLWRPMYNDVMEGYVVRTQSGFPYREFRKRVAKFVRPDHVTTDRHWKAGRVVETNGLVR